MNSNVGSKVTEYITRQLAATGFAVIDSALAKQLTGDLIWANATNALHEFTARQCSMAAFLSGFPRAEVLELRFEGTDSWTMVGARSRDDLLRRVAQVTRRAVAEFMPYVPPVSAAVASPAPAADGPPAYQCAERERWYYERGIPDPQRQPVAGAR